MMYPNVRTLSIFSFNFGLKSFEFYIRCVGGDSARYSNLDLVEGPVRMSFKVKLMMTGTVFKICKISSPYFQQFISASGLGCDEGD